MLRRLLSLLAASSILGLSMLAIALPETRLGFATLAAGLGGATWWVTRRLPARPLSLTEWRVATVSALVSGLLIAIAILHLAFPATARSRSGSGFATAPSITTSQCGSQSRRPVRSSLWC